jgi:large subunit ribosomal protein L22
MKTYARLRNFGVPGLKVRRFAGTIKGEPVNRALAILAVQSSPTCQSLHKLLGSAVANAENNNGLAPANLVVSNVLVDNGPTLKRIRPRARGRAYTIFKRSCHVTIELDLSTEAKRRAAAPAPDTAAPAKPAAKAPAKAPAKPAAKAAAAKPATKSTAKPATKGKA